MIQTNIPELPFLKEISFEVSGYTFKLKSGPLFGRIFGDREFIPTSFKISLEDREVTLNKIDMVNLNGQLIITYADHFSFAVITAFL